MVTRADGAERHDVESLKRQASMLAEPLLGQRMIIGAQPYVLLDQ